MITGKLQYKNNGNKFIRQISLFWEVRRHNIIAISKTSLAVAETGDHDMSRKVGEGCCAPLRGGSWSPSNTMSPQPRPSSVPSSILIHPTVWLQYTNVTKRQTGQRSHSIGRTVTCKDHPINLSQTAVVKRMPDLIHHERIVVSHRVQSDPQIFIVILCLHLVELLKAMPCYLTIRQLHSVCKQQFHVLFTSVIHKQTN